MSLPLIGAESMCFQHAYRHRQPTTICTFYLLHSVLLCTRAQIEALLSKRRYAKQLILFFPFVSFCVGPIWPLSCTRCAFPWSRSPSTLPFIFTPLPPAMNDSLGEAPFLHQKALQLYTYSPASISLISLCCVTLEKPLRSRTCFFFFSTLPLLLFLWVTFSIDCLCFLMLWRGPGACGWGKSALLDTLTPP